MEGPNPNDILQRAGGLAQNIEQINVQVIFSEAANKTQTNYITRFLMQD